WSAGSMRLSPPNQQGLQMAVDPPHHIVLLYGGSVSGSGDGAAETWSYEAGRWTQLHPAASPPLRTAAGMVYDASDRYVLLFGGTTRGNGWLNDSWSFSGGTWTNLT